MMLEMILQQNSNISIIKTLDVDAENAAYISPLGFHLLWF